MATNLAIDPDLLERALAIGGERTKKATVTKALEYIQRRAQPKIRASRGQFGDWDPTFDYKASRRARDRKLGLTE
ncbi:MAG: type II toxin-antitoxin system VapB family antitoxin [Microthrixaceae bacterium]|nr:type II toxin-antitoxin system VapB family antitoxin [Microthrixaceae bacterium]